MTDENVTPGGAGSIDRRTVLRMTSGTVMSGVAFSAVASANKGNGNGNGGGKSGGRGQTSDEIILNEPFEVKLHEDSPVTRGASCMSDNSAEQKYNLYKFEYCEEDCDTGEEGWSTHPETCTICVIPDDSDLNEDRVYEFRSEQECDDTRASKVSFGPSNSPHDC